MKKKITFYEVLVFIAYSFYLLLGLVWFIMSLFRTGVLNIHDFNPWAFFITIAFGAQFYFRHRLTNLILGILALFFSIWMLLDVINTYNLMAKQATYDNLAKGFLWFCLVSMIMALILIFGYTKLSFKDR
ncbi:MAG: hypothetical protein ACHQD8_04570 [Chitinophagales bacterium]